MRTFARNKFIALQLPSTENRVFIYWYNLREYTDQNITSFIGFDEDGEQIAHIKTRFDIVHKEDKVAKRYGKFYLFNLVATNSRVTKSLNLYSVILIYQQYYVVVGSLSKENSERKDFIKYTENWLLKEQALMKHNIDMLKSSLNQNSVELIKQSIIDSERNIRLVSSALIDYLKDSIDEIIG